MTNTRTGLVDDVILKLIWDKTRILFIKPEYGVHNIVPNNLREMAVLVNTLQDMKNPQNDDTILIRNINAFEDMFINSWITNILSVKHIKIIQQFLETDLEYKNKFIVTSIYNLLPNEFGEKMKLTGQVKSIDNLNDVKMRDKRILEILNFEITNPLNISIGDVIFALKIYKKYGLPIETEPFIFSIKTLYTIYLTKFIKTKIQCDFDKARILIGGNIYNIDYKNILPNRMDCKFIIKHNYMDSLKSDSSMKNVAINLSDIEGLPFIELANKKIQKNIQLSEWLSYFVLNIGTEIDFSPFTIFNRGFEQYKTSNDTYYSFQTNSLLEKNCTLNIFTFITSLLEPKRNSENHKEGTLSLFTNICKWREEYYSIIPIYSLDFIEQFTDNFIFSYQKEKDNCVDSFELIIKSIHRSIKEIFEKNKLIYSNDEINMFLNAVKYCPLTSCFFSGEKYNILFGKDDIENLWFPKVESKICITRTDFNLLDKSLAYFEEISKSDIVNDNILTKVNEVIEILQTYMKYEKTTNYIKLFKQMIEKLTIAELDEKSKTSIFKDVSLEMSKILKQLQNETTPSVKRKLIKKVPSTEI